MDISAITGSEGCRLRKPRGGGTPSGLPRVALELKRYRGDVSVGLARSALLAAIDLALIHGWRPGDPMPIVAHIEHAGSKSSGSLSASLVVLVTTAHRTGACAPLMAFYGASTWAAFTLDASAPPGTQSDVVQLAAAAQHYLP